MFDAVVGDLSVAPRFGVAAWAIVVATMAQLVLLAVRGHRAFRRLSAARPADPGALVAFYRRNVLRKVTLLLPFALLLVVPGPRPAQLGLAWPHGPSAGYGVGLFAYLAVFTLASALWYRRAALRGEAVPRPRRLDVLVATTPAERRWACAVSVSAGVCEELVFRGMLIAAGIALGWSPTVATLVSGALFGLVHLYQGWPGALLATALGLMMALLYVPTGSLLLPIALHVLIDLRGLVITPVAAPSPAPR
jgi:membrane protease YdiL (CAAX protease family)